MPSVDVEENIKQIRAKMEQMSQEIYRMQGMLSTFEGFKKGGLTKIDLPDNPYLEPIEKPIEKPIENYMNEPINVGKMMSTLLANPSMMAMAAAAMNNTASPGKDPNQPPVEELNSVQEKPE